MVFVIFLVLSFVMEFSQGHSNDAPNAINHLEFYINLAWVSPENKSSFNEKNQSHECPPKISPVSMRKIRVNECPPKISPVSMRKIRVNCAHKPHNSWRIRPAAGMLVRCADDTRCNHFAIFPAFPSHPPGTWTSWCSGTLPEGCRWKIRCERCRLACRVLRIPAGSSGHKSRHPEHGR